MYFQLILLSSYWEEEGISGSSPTDLARSFYREVFCHKCRRGDASMRRVYDTPEGSTHDSMNDNLGRFGEDAVKQRYGVGIVC